MVVRTASQTSLCGVWLVLARTTWVMLVILALGLFAFSVRDALVYAQAKPGLSVDVDSFTRPYVVTGGSDLEHVLGKLGLPVNGYVWYISLLEVLQVLVFTFLGLVIFWHRSNDGLALLVSLMLVTFGVSSVTHIRPPWDAVTKVLYSLGAVLILCWLYLFPDGRFVPRWAWALVILGALWRLSYLVAAPFTQRAWPPSPSHLLGLALYGVGVAAQIYRYRRVSNLAQRQQTKWAVLGLIIAAVGVYGYTLYWYISKFGLVPWLMQAQRYLYLYLLFWQPFRTVALLAAPVTMGISIMRYRLWDIDLVINRGLVYGSLTVLLAALFSGTLLAVSWISHTVTGGQQYVLAIAASALICGALFQPTRHRLQCLVDRHVYGIQIDYQRGAPPPGRAPEADHPLRIGAYTDLELVGRGGMAEVYVAKDPARERPVAVKLLFSHLVQDANAFRRLEREARIAVSLRHANIVRVYECGEAGGRHYLVMEYIAGPNLGDFLDRHGRLPPALARSILQDVASALDYVHGKGLVHRDVKSSNVMLDPTMGVDGRDVLYRAKIADFGLACVADHSTRLSHSGVIGTLSYIAPEQIQSPGEVDGRADVYALGITAYQMLTGELPFKQQNPGALLIAHLTQPPPDPREVVPDLPEQVVVALRRALAKRPEDRYPTAGEFVRALGS